MINDRTLIDEAKRRVSLSTAAASLGLGILKPNGVQRSPFREDRHPSFSVSDDTLWKDFSTGEGGDVVSFIEAATGCTTGAAIAALLQMAGIQRGDTLPPPRPRPRPPAPPRQTFDRLTKLPLDIPTVGELARISTTRRWPVFAGLEIAARRGLLRTANIQHGGGTHRAWVVTDAARKSGQARRMDGEHWNAGAHLFKSLTLRSDEENPIGLADTDGRELVMICEGEPDALAALTLAWFADLSERVGLLCMPGVARSLPDSVAQRLSGRRVHILRQVDEPAQKATIAWGTSFHPDLVTVFDITGHLKADGRQAKDIADLLADRDENEAAKIAKQLFEGVLK